MIEHKTNFPNTAKVFLTIFLMFVVFGMALAISLLFDKKDTPLPAENEVVPTAEIKLPETSFSPTPIPTSSNSEKSSATVDAGCKVAGCNNELCISESDEVATTICVFKKRFECYQNATCKNIDGEDCEWVMDSKLTSCISQKDAEEKMFCGGIAGTSCPEGFECKLEDSKPDAGGTCVRR